MHKSLVPFLLLVLTLGLGSLAQAGQHENENPCAAKDAGKENPCAARAADEANPCAAKTELPPVESDAEEAETEPEREDDAGA